MEQHIAKVQNMAANLIDLGETLSDAAIAAKLLASVTTKYSTLQTAWESVDPERQTLENLQARLIREEARLKSGDDASESMMVVSKKGQETKKKKRSLKKILCFKCHEMGHYVRDCKSEKRGKSESGNKDECDCAFVGASNAASGAKSVAVSCSELPHEAVRTLQDAEQKETWLTDSGASAHMTYRHEWFAEYQENPRGKVVLGDNDECSVIDRGKINIMKLVDGV